jgi:hypothetical protein
MMTTQDPKIISFETVQAKQKEGQKLSSARIATELKSIYSQHLTELFLHFFAAIDDDLFKRSTLSAATQQSTYFDTMRQMRVEAASLQANILSNIAYQFDDFLRSDSQKKKQQAAGQDGSLIRGMAASDDLGFSLVDNEVLEEEIAVTSMIEKANNLFQSPLFALNKRLGALAERENVETADNPLAHPALCNAFVEALKPLNLGFTIKLLSFKLFDQAVLSGMGKLYYDLNNFLVNEGVLPTLTRNIKRSSSASGAVSHLGGGFQGQGGPADEDMDENQHAYMEMFQGMQRLLEGWRTQMGFPALPGGGGGLAYGKGPAMDTGEVLSALSALQAPAAVEAQAGEGLKVFIAEQLLKGEARSIARPDEDIIDMVALIFDFILEDRNLPDPVKGVIARLQIPVIKVAMLEKSFFGRKNHPVRLLLNALAQGGVGLDASDSVTDTPMFKKIESIVNRVLDEFDQNVGLFSDLLDEFMAFMEKEFQRSRVAEERTRQVTQSKEQLQLAKRKIAYEIASRLEGKPVPAAVRSFLYNTWKDVLVLAYLRRDKQAGDWDVALEVMDKLIWSVIPPRDPTTRKAIIQTIPKLIKAIRAGLESISLDPQSVANAVKELEASHVTCLSASAHEAEPGSPASDKLAAASPAEPSVEIRDPELAQAIVEIRSNLPDIENLSIQDLSRPVELMGSSDYSVSELSLEDEYVFKARALQVGEWVEFDDAQHKKLRGKLSWKSQVTSTYVFVNRKGAKVLEIALSDLARKMSQNQARVIEDVGTPLMDRAFGALMSKLKGSTAAKAAP